MHIQSLPKVSNDTLFCQTGILIAYKMEYGFLYFIPTKQLNINDYTKSIINGNIEKAYPVSFDELGLATYNTLLSSMDTFRLISDSSYLYMTPVYLEYVNNVYPDISYLRPDEVMKFSINNKNVRIKINYDLRYYILKIFPLKPYQYKEIIKPEDIPIM